MKKVVTTTIVLIFVLNMSFAQNETKRIALGINASLSDYYGPDGEGFYKVDQYNFNKGPVNLTVAYNLIKPINLATSFTSGDVNVINRDISDNLYWKWDLGFQFRFLSLLADDDLWFDPYFFGNVGVFKLDATTSPVVNGGLGLNFWISENVALSAQSGYNYGFDLDNYYETLFGIKIRFGKSADSDGDGISDKKDDCPNTKGLEAFNGCPDSDGDGIVDSKDDCPNTKGLNAFNGCPDTDGDGIIDKLDECPNTKGLEALKGCPDSDEDGIADKNDDCPNVKGLENLKGCPDSDGDGIADKDDKCPNIKGHASLSGCPDRDGDGIADDKDDCPDVAGLAKLNGCPKLKEEKKKEIEDELKFSAKNIQFNSGKSTIKTVSYKDIDNIVDIMKKYPKVNFSIEGHTDNTGNYDSNKKLSQNRADAVKNYIVNKGISASRLSAKGFGSDKPIAENNTSQGRQQNRRVEFVINQ